MLGIVPKEAKVAPLKGFHWVTDAHYMCVPKGVPPEKLAVLLDLMAFLLTPEAQAYTYDKGYFYPGPAVKDVPLVDGAEGEPGRDQGIRPARIRQVDRRQPARAAARRPSSMVVAFRMLGRAGRRRRRRSNSIP